MPVLPDPLPPGPLAAGQPRDAIVAEVRRVLETIPTGRAVLVALSGGPDSTALAYLTAEARPDLDLTLGHVRHGLRDDAADVDVVERHASFLGVELAVAQVDVEVEGEGLEAAARRERYAALRRQAFDVGAEVILVGHTADDQAETLLLRIARGTGVPGLGGMAARWRDLVRPLLRLRRADIRGFVAQEGLDAVEDPTNADVTIPRVVARSRVLPLLEQLGPDPVGALARLADLARRDASKLDADADAVVRALVAPYGPALAVPAEALRALDPAVATRVVRDLTVTARPGHEPPSSAQVATVLTLRPGSAVDLPGVSVTRGGGWLAFAPRDLPVVGELPLELPGRTSWPAVGVDVLAATVGADGSDFLQLALQLPEEQRRGAAPPVGTLPPGADPALARVTFGAEALAGPRLVLRPRRAGDRIATTAGTKKLQDVLVDAGIPRVLRDLVPLVAAGERVLWVPGLVADLGALDDPGDEAAALHLAITRSG